MATCPDCGKRYRNDVRVCEVDGVPLLPDEVVAHLDDDLKPGDEVGDYAVDAKIGGGAFGVVYSATHLLIGKRAAIKVLASRHSTNRQTVSRFLAEARAVNQIRHKHIVDIFAFGTLEDGRQYFVMELLEGRTLEAHLAERGALPPAEALPILRRIARALDAAHKAGIAHRDLKPDNVFLVVDEDGVFPKLLDFGVAKLLDDTATLHKTGTGTPMGTPLYMSPEQWRGKNVDHRSDIFSLGVMAFELLAGDRPFAGESPMDLMVKVATEQPPRLSSFDPQVPPEADDALRAMLAANPDDRPASASAAIRALSEAYGMHGRSVDATFEPGLMSEPPDKPGRTTSGGVSQTLSLTPTNRRPWWLAGIAAAVVIGIAVGAGWTNESTSPIDADLVATSSPGADPLRTSEPEEVPTAEPGALPTAQASAEPDVAPSAQASAEPAVAPSASAAAVVRPPPVAQTPPRPKVPPAPPPGPSKTRPIIPVLER
ncbi:MAG: serine/threonine-protein kinase [Polyangiaceae bacterium]